jgi:hypothetical protein
MRWSYDGHEWQFSPVDFEAWTSPPPFFSGLARHEVSEILDSGFEPPFARELFREAWSQKEMNPRSALVIGVAALETGIKELIVGLFPETTWLVRNLPSPPINRILIEYFPLLQINNQRLRCPSTEMIKGIQKWILKRNELSHGKSAEIDVDELTNLLLLVSDLLYVCDYARGFDWALELVRPQTRQCLV